MKAIQQGFTAINKICHGTIDGLRTAIQDIGNVLEADTALKELHSKPSSLVADTAAGPPQPSQSASKLGTITADPAVEPPQPSRSVLEPDMNVRNRMVDEGQLGTSALSKSLRST